MRIHEFTRQSPMPPSKIQPFFVKNENLINPSKRLQQNRGHILEPNENILKKWIFDVLSEFTAKSSIHAISYIGDRKRHWIERLWWLIAFLLSLSLCVSSIYSFLSEWRDNLIIIGSSPTPWPIGEIPFPAVTICLQDKFASKKFNYTGVYRALLKLDGNQSRSVTDEELEYMKFAPQICDRFSASTAHKLFNDSFLDSQTISKIRSLAPNLDDTLVECVFDGKNCAESLFPIVTEEGLCYTFNGFNANEIFTDESAKDTHSLNPPLSEWQMEGGYTDPKNREAYPYRVFSNEPQSLFNALLKVFNNETNYLCSGGRAGFKIAFHVPNEQPDLWKSFSFVSPNHAALFRLTPKFIVNSPSAHGYNPNIRKCFFPFERRLRYFKDYTQRNCELECLTNASLAECGCTKFSLPRSKADKICGPAKMDCATKVAFRLFQSNNINVCNCLLTCTSLSYAIDSTQTEFNLAQMISKSKFYQTIDCSNLSFGRIVVSFSADDFIPQQRTESYSLIDVLAVSGGLFGLFMGASLLSFVELFYYFTIRVFFTRCKKHKAIDPSDEYPANVFVFLP